MQALTCIVINNCDPDLFQQDWTCLLWKKTYLWLFRLRLLTTSEDTCVRVSVNQRIVQHSVTSVVHERLVEDKSAGGGLREHSPVRLRVRGENVRR